MQVIIHIINRIVKRDGNKFFYKKTGERKTPVNIAISTGNELKLEAKYGIKKIGHGRGISGLISEDSY